MGSGEETGAEGTATDGMAGSGPSEPGAGAADAVAGAGAADAARAAGAGAAAGAGGALDLSGAGGGLLGPTATTRAGVSEPTTGVMLRAGGT